MQEGVPVHLRVDEVDIPFLAALDLGGALRAAKPRVRYGGIRSFPFLFAVSDARRRETRDRAVPASRRRPAACHPR